VYETILVTPELVIGVPTIMAPELIGAEVVSVPTLPPPVTDLVKEKFIPPTLTAKLAVPPLFGVPVMV
jgi:hypothetical protein